MRNNRWYTGEWHRENYAGESQAYMGISIAIQIASNL